MQNQINKKSKLSENTYSMWIEHRDIVNHYKPGQFIIIRLNEKGERIPLTIADVDKKKSQFRIIFQVLGKTTTILANHEVNDRILDILGPLGNSFKINNKIEKALLIGGGIGIAPLYPKIKDLNKKDINITVILGSKNREDMILDDEIEDYVENIFIMTDDGSKGEKGFVTKKQTELLNKNNKYDICLAIGPIVMMKNVVKINQNYNLKTLVSLNSLMVDGTGMCGGCRLMYDGKIKFTCVDGPIFNGFKVNFDELLKRNNQYSKDEKIVLNKKEGSYEHKT